VTSGRLLAIGDIHGCRNQLVDLLTKVNPRPADQLVFLGDYIDRGPDARGVIDELLSFRQHHPHSIFLKGNHEAMFLDFVAGRNPLCFLLNGGDATLDGYRQNDAIQIPQEHLDFLRSLKLYHETDNFIFVHAGLRPGLPLELQQQRDLLWIRAEFLASDYDWGKTVVFGHTPQDSPLMTATRIGLDTGAVYGRTLTCCDVQSRTCWHAP
jgi:serine/threonine protein phosphatase 1